MSTIEGKMRSIEVANQNLESVNQDLTYKEPRKRDTAQCCANSSFQDVSANQVATMGIEEKSRTSGKHTQVASNAHPVGLLNSASRLFRMERPTTKELVEAGYESLSETLTRVVAPMTWQEMAEAPKLQGPELGNLDLGDIPLCLSRSGLLYYLPGMLLHFLRNGLYEDSVFGRTFYFNLIERIQPDDERVVSFGGPSVYFNYNSEQTQAIKEFLMAIMKRYGDPFISHATAGSEHRFLAKHSGARALNLFWNR